jgi:hypothetical protein
MKQFKFASIHLKALVHSVCPCEPLCLEEPQSQNPNCDISGPRVEILGNPWEFKHKWVYQKSKYQGKSTKYERWAGKTGRALVESSWARLERQIYCPIDDR